MDNNLRESILLRLNSTANALRKNRMEAYVVENKEELLNKIAGLISKDETVFTGGSATLKEAGVIDMLNRDGYDYYYRGRCDADGKEIDVLRKAFYGDWYITSSNAITLNGELYNVDGNANRVAALSFGPKNVIVVAGYNKVVKDLSEAVERVKAIAAPANCVRLDKLTGCRASGHCSDCHSDDRICSAYTVHSFQRFAGRIKVFLLPEELGY
ncbi:MAG: lactate utilization protein [Clostridia bacterium]|nr:lactate utilization protein [Clostridia bacterium]